MSYEVLARKWRPQQFSEVVGQNHVVQTLINAIKQNRVAHAYIFVGPRGTGKTTLARLLAKSLNCKDGPKVNFDPNEVSCIEIAEGRSIDVIEIDGASNNSVDQIRELRDNARYLPTNGKYKIYIIDEVHMLTTAAFNALLKTLEEPPNHVKFIFATTDVHKVLPTILSRCQRFDLRRISINDIMNRLQNGCEKEGINISDTALSAIARGAEGGMRDAESALDQLISFRGKDIKEEDVLSVFGLVSADIIEKLSVAIINNNVPVIISVISDMDNLGKDLQRIVIDLLDLFRNLLIVSYGEDNGVGTDISELKLEFLKEQLNSIDTSKILRVIDALIETDERMRYALSKKTLIEIGLIRCAYAADTITINELMREIDHLKKKEFEIENESESNSSNQVNSSEINSHNTNIENSYKIKIAQLIGNWPKITDDAANADSLSKTYLHDTKPLSIENDKLIIGFDPEFSSEHERFKDHRLQIALSRSIHKQTGVKLKLSFRPLEESEAKKLPTDHPVAQNIPTNMSNKLDQIEYDHPVIKEVVEVFNARIIDIRT